MRIYTLSNQSGTQARLTSYGATLMSLRSRDRRGQLDEVILGFDEPEAYKTAAGYPGAIIGRFANRLAKGRFHLDGTTYQLAVNNGVNHLHGGVHGFDQAEWQVAATVQIPGQPQREGESLLLTYTSVDGEEGYPGTLLVQVRYTLSSAHELWIDYAAVTDRPTILNLTNHAYFNLAGAKARDILDHQLRLHAGFFTPVDPDLIPTGELRAVNDTPFDFRLRQRIGARLAAPDLQLQIGNGYDHNFVLDGAAPSLRVAAEVYEPLSGRTLEVRTTQPCLQFYTGNYFPGAQLPRHPHAAPRHAGFCLETQHAPDAPNQANFASARLAPGEIYLHTTVYRFGVAGDG